MKKLSLFLFVLFLGLFLYGCAPVVETGGKTDEEIVSATATVQAVLSELPDDIPIHSSAEKLKFAAANTYITYEVPGTVDEIVDYYRSELLAKGWEKKNNSPEEPIGGSLTILRSLPEKNISVTIQGIPESEFVRVLISIIQK